MRGCVGHALEFEHYPVGRGEIVFFVFLNGLYFLEDF